MIKTLRASGSNLQADVVIGKNKFGSDVTVQLNVARKDPALAEALAPLEEYLRNQADSLVTTAVSEALIQEQVEKRMEGKLEGLRKRVEADTNAKIAAAEETSSRRVQTIVSDLRQVVRGSLDVDTVETLATRLGQALNRLSDREVKAS